VRIEQLLERLPKRLHHLPVVGQLQIGRRKAAREQQSIALADRQIEVLGQVDEELATRAGPAGLDEAQVLGRDVPPRDGSSWLRPRRVRQKRISSPAV
jgi:hypothetical protein